MSNVTADGKLGRGIVVTDGDKSRQVPGVVLIDATTGLPIGMSGSAGFQVTSGQISQVTANIANGASQSAALDLAVARLGRITLPAAWTAADLTFLVSDDNITFNPLYDKDGVEYKVVAAASRTVLIAVADFLGVRYLKIRSGTVATPVAQGASRDLILTLVP